MKIYIRAMSEELQEIKRKLSDIGDELNMHLLKVMLYSDADEYNHWKGEIYGFLHKVARSKGKNKWPKQSLIFEWISVYSDMITEYVELVKGEEPDRVPRAIDISTLERAIQEYAIWISTELSSRGIVTKPEVYAKIDEIVESTL